MSSAPREEGRARRRRRRGGGRNENDQGADGGRAAERADFGRGGGGRGGGGTPGTTAGRARGGGGGIGRRSRVSGADVVAESERRREEAAGRQRAAREKEELERAEEEREEKEKAEREEEAREIAKVEEEERAAKELKEREAVAAAERARRKRERDLNLSYSSTRSGEGPFRERPSGSELRLLDSSLKKCTGFVRKIRVSGITEESVGALRQEAAALNLSRYISEVVAAIAESKLRSAEVEHVLSLCGELHRRYEDFIGELVVALGTVVMAGPGGTSVKDLSMRKAAMRLLVETFVLGMNADVNPLIAVLKTLVKGGKEAKDEVLNSLIIVATFVRVGSHSMLPERVPQDSEGDMTTLATSESRDWEKEVLPRATQLAVLSALQTYYENEVRRLLEGAADSFKKAALTFSRSKNARGDPDDAASSTFEAAKQLYEKAKSATVVLSEALTKPPIRTILDETAPSSVDAKSAVSQDAVRVTVANPMLALAKSRDVCREVNGIPADDPFDGDEEREFYTDLPLLVGSIANNDGKPRNDQSSGGSRANVGGDVLETRKSLSPPSVKSGAEETEQATQPVFSQSAPEGRKRGSERVLSMDKVLGRLSSVESKKNVDSFVSLFIDAAENSKNGPKRLIKSLLTVSAQKLNLLPAYARIAASLYPRYSEVAVTVASSLEEEFRYLAGKADMDEKNLASCVKNTQYIGEYVKFGLLGTSTMFDLLSLCIKDFSGHRVDLACHLLETCGRFAYRTPATHMRMGNILETLWRLKSVKNLEARHNALVETAFFSAKPASGNRLQQRKSRPPVFEYIRHLIYDRLDASNIDWTQNQFLKLPWDEELEYYVVKKFVKISRARYSTIPYVSSLIAALQRFRPGLGIATVDSLLESIRAGMERNDGRDSQRRIAEIRLLGELYKSGVVDERVIYNTLYQSITLGHDSPETDKPRTAPSSSGLTDLDQSSHRMSSGRSVGGTYTFAPDPPGDFFRIRICCVLIETCGRLLVASNRRKLEVFWIFFERYIFCKTFQAGLGDRLPLHISHVIGDAFEDVLQRERRAGRDNRPQGRRGLENAHRNRGKPDTQWLRGERRSTKEFLRCRSLTEALKAVQEVERSAHDSALVCVPIRHISLNAAPDVGSDAAFASPATSQRGPNHREKTGLPSPEDSAERFSEDDDHGGDQGEHDSANGPLPEYVTASYSVDQARTADDASMQESDSNMDSINGDENDADVVDDVEDDEDDNDDDDDDDDDSILDVRVERPKTEEEDAFAKELAAFTAASVQGARASSSRITKFDRMTIPMALMTKKMEEDRAAAAAAAAVVEDDDYESSDDEPGDPDVDSRRKPKAGFHSAAVEFKLLIRKGGKSTLQDLEVPASSSLALAAKENETADAARHAETKRLVLGSSTVLNHDEDEVDEDVPLRTPQDVRAKEESIRQQRSASELELLSTLYRGKSKPWR